MQLFSAEATIFKENLRFFFCPPKHRKTAKKVAHNPTRPKVLVQQVFGFVELSQFFTLCFFFSSLKLSNFAG